MINLVKEVEWIVNISIKSLAVIFRLDENEESKDTAI